METIYKTGSSIKGPITSAIDISSCPGKEFIAMANANGEFLANVVMVRLAYSEYVKLIFSDNNKSIIVFIMKNMINGMKISSTESKFTNNCFPWLANMQNTASDKNHISNDEKRFTALSVKSGFKSNFVTVARINGITITIKIE